MLLAFQEQADNPRDLSISQHFRTSFRTVYASFVKRRFIERPNFRLLFYQQENRQKTIDWKRNAGFDIVMKRIACDFTCSLS